MEKKKTPQADIEKRRGLFLQLGLIFSLGMVFLGINYRFSDADSSDFNLGLPMEIPMELAPLSMKEPVFSPPPPPVATTILQIVDNSIAVNQDIKVQADDHPLTQDLGPSSALSSESSVSESEIFTRVEQAPAFPGGEAARIRFLQGNIRYPEEAKRQGVQGTVYITFIIERDGSVSNARVSRGLGYGADEEALRVVALMPRWSPGKQRGKPVRVIMNMPIRFALQL